MRSPCHSRGGCRLGRRVAARRVATPKEIRQFAIGHIADFKVPRQVSSSRSRRADRESAACRLGGEVGACNRPVSAADLLRYERLSRKCWPHLGEVLQLEEVGIHDDFFALGGDFSATTLLVAHIRTILNNRDRSLAFFRGADRYGVAHHLETLIHFAHALQLSSALSPLPEKGMPASIAQDVLRELQQALPDLPVFNILYVLRLTTPFDVAVLERSINEIVRRHEILRTTFAVIDSRSCRSLRRT